MTDTDVGIDTIKSKPQVNKKTSKQTKTDAELTNIMLAAKLLAFEEKKAIDRQRQKKYWTEHKESIIQVRKVRLAAMTSSEKKKITDKAKQYYNDHKKPTKPRVKPPPIDDPLSEPLLAKLNAEIKSEREVLSAKQKQANLLRVKLYGRKKRAKLVAEGKSTYTPEMAIAIKKHQQKKKRAEA